MRDHHRNWVLSGPAFLRCDPVSIRLHDEDLHAQHSHYDVLDLTTRCRIDYLPRTNYTFGLEACQADESPACVRLASHG